MSDTELAPGPGESLDALLASRLKFIQPQKGYRFSVDAVLLAGFARLEPGWRVLDLGSGVGVLCVLLAWAEPRLQLTALEIQPELARLTLRNAALNQVQDRLAVFEGDLRRPDLFPAESFDAVVVNPPFRPLGAGRLSPDEQKNKARHELTASLAEWTSAAARWLRAGGRLFVVYPVWRLTALLSRLEGVGLTPKRLRLAYARPGGPGRLALVEAVSGGGDELAVAPPFFIHGPGQDWSEEMDRLAKGELIGRI